MTNDNNNKDGIIEVAVNRSDLIFLRRALDGAIPELEAAVADGLVDEAVLIELDSAIDVVDGYLK